MSTNLPQLSATQDHDSTLIALTVEEAARRLGVGRTTMFALIRTGEVPSIPIGRLRRVPAEALTQYVRRRMQESGFAPIAA
ncbi:helix-turn-helix domain-containing protein [Streptomyces sp. TLI_171]|uniref:helix-turn-helix domain-containing protein n=1 Tax=Streptomyces sp. TLI_171 TaxID=1938859 RepID=UPI000C19E8E6|nr:helix-turn-helix domain-containing protein [Streptomyces sp. TLI_171]RKE20114.1 excisionase family DNA binding protein [Streptomyces sp. TLI_171]